MTDAEIKFVDSFKCTKDCKNCCITSIYRTNDGKSIEICPVDNEIIKVSKR